MSGYLDTLIGFVTGTSNEQTETTKATSTTPKRPTPRPHGTTPNRLSQPSQPSPMQGVKRQLPTDLDTEKPEAKKPRSNRDTRTADEKRLFGHYSSPADAITIGPPGARAGAHSGPPATAPVAGTPLPNMTKKVGGNTRINVWKPQNTLASDKFGGGARKGPVTSSVAGRAQQPQRLLEVGRRGGGNVRATGYGRGDGFMEAPLKRQKLNDGMGQGKANSPVVLVDPVADMDSTGDVNEEDLLSGRPVQQNSRKLSNGGSQSSVQMLSSSKTSKQLSPFGRHSIRNTNELLNGPRKRGQVRSQQGTNLARSRNGSVQDLTGTDNEPVMILEDDPAISRRARTQAVVRNREPPTRQQQLEQEANHRRRQGMDDEVEEVQPRRGKGVNVAHDRPNGTAQGSAVTVASDYFQPKSGPQPKPKARHQMQTDSKMAARESVASVDELAGGTTVGHGARGRRSASRDSHDERESPEPNLKPTRFTSSGRNRGQRSSPDVPQSLNEGVSSPNTIRIRAFYSSDCIAQEGDLRLAFDEREKQVYLYRDDRPVLAANTNRLVHIEPANARELFLSAESNRVVMKGSHTTASRGCICVVLYDQESVNWLYGCVQEITDEHYKLANESAPQMDKLFNRQVTDIRIWYEKAKTQSRVAVEDAELKLLRKHQASTAARAQSEEHIVYEDEEEPPGRTSNDAPSTKRQQQLAYRQVPRNSTLTHSNRQAQAQEPRRSTRAAPVQARIKTREPTPPLPVRWTEEHKPQRWPHPVVYPSEGPRRTTVDFGDLTRLDEGEFLNDNLISYALRRTEENLSAEQRGRIHFFNTFFYSSLSTNNGKREFNYDAVKRWTKGKDLMKTPYVVVPINHDLHWFVAIICNLDKVAEEGDIPDGNDEAQTATGPANSEAIKAESLNVEMKDLDISETIKLDNVDDIEHVAIPLDVEEKDGTDSRPNTATGKKSKKKAPPPLPKYDLNQPAVITLDSFGSAHSGEVKMLKRYVVAEAADKRDMTVDEQQIRGLTAKGLPEQTNFCDCGVFLIGYIEQFAKDPDGFVRAILQRELHKNEEFGNFDPSKKRDELRDSLLELQGQQENERRAKKLTKSATKPRTAMPALATAPKSPTPGKAVGSVPAKAQMPRLPARPKEQARRSSSPSRQPPAQGTIAIPPSEAQMQGELATSMHSPLTKLDANQPGDTVPNSQEPDYSDHGESTDDSSPRSRGQNDDEMLDKPAYVVDKKARTGQHTFFKSSPAKRNAIDTLPRDDGPGMPAYDSGLVSFVEDSQEG